MAILLAGDFTSVAARGRRIASGEVISLARGIWTDEVSAAPEAVVEREWRTIVSRVMPGAVITYRSAFTMRPIDGQLFVNHARTRILTLPGLTIYPDGETSRQDATVPMGTDGTLFGVTRTRGLIDNAEQRGRPAAVARRLSETELHDLVAGIVATSTRTQVDNTLADISLSTNSSAANKLREVFEAALGERTIQTSSTALRAAQTSESFDIARVALFRQVADALTRIPLIQRFDDRDERHRFVPFYEAYFSNYIEGSTLDVDEAVRVIFEDADVGKPEDSHDIRATYEVVGSTAEMSRRPKDADDFMLMLRERHAVMMAAHPDKTPGLWKSEANRAGETVFVRPEHVQGTLRHGWEAGQILTHPFARAVFIMFLVAEVHPFADGNGRSARVAMNAELVAAGMQRIVVPTILRDDYVSGLYRTTVGNGPEALVRVLDRAQQWVATGEFATIERADKYLRVTRAHTDSGVALRNGIHLRILEPGELDRTEDPGYDQPTVNGTDPGVLGMVLDEQHE